MPRRKPDNPDDYEVLFTEEEKAVLLPIVRAAQAKHEAYLASDEYKTWRAEMDEQIEREAAGRLAQSKTNREASLKRWRDSSRETLPHLWKFLGAEGLTPSDLPPWSVLNSRERRTAIQSAMPFAEITPGITLTSVAQRAWDAAAGDPDSLRCEICAETLYEITERPDDGFTQPWRAGERARALEIEMRLTPDRKLQEETRRDLYRQALRSGLSVDHRIPLARGGTHTWENVALVHFRCNLRKGDR
jgi:hypothetical protein